MRAAEVWRTYSKVTSNREKVRTGHEPLCESVPKSGRCEGTRELFHGFHAEHLPQFGCLSRTDCRSEYSIENPTDSRGLAGTPDQSRARDNAEPFGLGPGWVLDCRDGEERKTRTQESSEVFGQRFPPGGLLQGIWNNAGDRQHCRFRADPEIPETPACCAVAPEVGIRGDYECRPTLEGTALPITHGCRLDSLRSLQWNMALQRVGCVVAAQGRAVERTCGWATSAP